MHKKLFLFFLLSAILFFQNFLILLFAIFCHLFFQWQVKNKKNVFKQTNWSKRRYINFGSHWVKGYYVDQYCKRLLYQLICRTWILTVSGPRLIEIAIEFPITSKKWRGVMFHFINFLFKYKKNCFDYYLVLIMFNSSYV